MKSLYAYCDESGNTGLFNNDPKQPVLTYSAVISEADLDGQTYPEITAACSLAGLSYLHASKIDRAVLGDCCELLLPLFQRLNIQFFSCLIDKLDFAKVNLFDMFFDSGLNRRVSPFHYGIRANRLPLALNFIQTISEDNALEFWIQNLKGDYPTLRETVADIFDNFCAVTQLDHRTRELIIDALDFYMENSQIFHDSMAKDFSSPNIAGFSLLIQTLHEHYGDKSFRVAQVKHDIQQEFSDQLSFLFNTHGQWEFQRGHMSLISDMDKSSLMPPEIVFSESKKSSGIQMTDFISYLVQLKHKGKLPETKEFKDFLKWFHKNSWHTGLSTKYLVGEVQQIVNDLGKKKLTKTDLERGLKLQTLIEQKRKEVVASNGQ